MYGYHDSEESIYDEWGYHSSVNVSVDFLLPTGIYIPMEVPRTATIKEVKWLLWKEAVHYPLFSKLTNKDSYTFVYVTNTGLKEEIVDENRHLSEFDLIRELPVLRLIQSQGNIEEKRIVQEIHQLAGVKNENELEKDLECQSFRLDLKELAKVVAEERDALHWKDLLKRHYPPSIIPYLNLQTHCRREYGLIQLQYENTETVYTIKVNPSWGTNELTNEAVTTLSKRLNLPTSNPDDYVLKASGKEFVVGNHEICMFKCLRDALVVKRDSSAGHAKSAPVLTLMHVGVVRQFLPESSRATSLIGSDLPPRVPGKNRKEISLWKMEEAFNVHVVRAGNVNIGQEKDKKLIVHIGLYHGLETLCQTAYTKDHMKEGTGHEYIWRMECNFDIKLQDIPPNAKLCMTICTINNSNKMKKQPKRQENYHKALLANTNPIAWVNMALFDFNLCLKMGTHRLNCWLIQTENLDANGLKPSGVLSTNPNMDEAPFLEIVLTEFNNQLKYPSYDEVLENAASQAKEQTQDIFPSPSKSHLVQLSDVVKKDRFDDLFDSERRLLWFLRLDCRDRHPEALAKVLISARWNSYRTVAMVQAMLEAWPPLPPERAMELLDCQFANQRVRDFAVTCLRKLRDDELLQYLMQLVQVLKFETYIDSSLVRFLLERAWKNRRIGHFFFWHLKAEANNPATSVRFSLILEAYLYGNIPHMKDLFKQNEALTKMKTLSERVKDPKFKQSDVKTLARNALKETAQQASILEALSKVECPLEPNLSLDELVVEKCKVMNSKMRPLWLDFKNADNPNGQISLLYKNGDDLRQDTLTLQIIKIMDTLWKSEGLDLRMIPYGCLATGSETGMIEVVMYSNTIANIQKSKSGKVRSAFRHQSLLEWIEEKNPTKAALEQAIENFTYSCAGYCVATYVLGVGDRHSDNIMITESGQLFHIDFGHILGKFKSKYGIKRERVPFVLAHDFVHVINKGKTNEKKEFEVFRKLCDHAFCILRKKGYLFITLFSLMLHSGLPELTSNDDLEYLRETLALHLTEEKALQLFRGKFKKALQDAWSTSMNWFFHNVYRA